MAVDITPSIARTHAHALLVGRESDLTHPTEIDD
jgi:hypothetical protein